MRTTTLDGAAADTQVVTTDSQPSNKGRRTASEPPWISLLAKMLPQATLFALSILGILPSTANDVSGQRYVKALVIGNSTDPDLTARNDVLARGGSIYFRYVSVAVLSVMLPANRVADIAIAPALRKC